MNVFVVDAGVGRTNGLISFAVEEHNGHGHVACESVATDGGRPFSKRFASRDLCIEISEILPLDVIQIDVEGHEFRLLKVPQPPSGNMFCTSCQGYPKER